MFDQLDFRSQWAGVASLLTAAATGGMSPSRQELPRRHALIEDLAQHAGRPILPAGLASNASRCRSGGPDTTGFPEDFYTLHGSASIIPHNPEAYVATSHTTRLHASCATTQQARPPAPGTPEEKSFGIHSDLARRKPR
jgi:hypothetical protein